VTTMDKLPFERTDYTVVEEQGTASEFLERGTICTHKSWKYSLA
jgi:hypothetical protein